MAKSKTVELKVDFHASGSYTLKARQGAKGTFTDPDPDSALFNNHDKGEFDRAVDREIARRRAEGWQIIYNDTEADEVV